MKKTLNIKQIQNELRGNSAFFPGYKRNASPTTLPEEPGEAKEPVVPPPVPVPVPEPVPGSLLPTTIAVPKVQRRLIRRRHPFDIYEDQFVRLKQIAEKEKELLNGRGMSQMVREAIDKYLKERYPKL